MLIGSPMAAAGFTTLMGHFPAGSRDVRASGGGQRRSQRSAAGREHGDRADVRARPRGASSGLHADRARRRRRVRGHPAVPRRLLRCRAARARTWSSSPAATAASWAANTARRASRRHSRPSSARCSPRAEPAARRRPGAHRQLPLAGHAAKGALRPPGARLDRRFGRRLRCGAHVGPAPTVPGDAPGASTPSDGMVMFRVAEVTP